MDIATTVLEYLKVLVWPLTLILILVLYYKPLSSLVDRLRTFKGPGGFEIEAEEMKKAQEESTQDVIFTWDPSLDEDKSEEVSIEAGSYPDTKPEDSTRSETPRQSAPLSVRSMSEIKDIPLNAEFERIYNLIFGSQIMLLEVLNADSDKKLPLKTVGFIYKNIRKSENSLKDWSMRDYLKFLVGENLAEVVDKKNIRLTEHGREFLEYVNGKGYVKIKPL
jgi:hypothetical protein